MLGNVSDAEDIVQDVFTQYLQLDEGKVVNEKAYLAKMIVNRCLNLLRSSRRVREQYVGPWLPEPLPDDDAGTWIDPAVRRENIGYAYLVLLHRLTPLERVVFLLKETFGFDYTSIAEMLEKSAVSCRKTFSRAMRKMGQIDTCEQTKNNQIERQEQFVEAFLRASDSGDFKPLITMLLEDVTLVSDGGGKARAAMKPIYGIARVIAFFEGLAAKGVFREGFRPVRFNGDQGLALRREGKVALVLYAEREPGGSRIQHVWIVVNPDKLRRFNHGSLETSRLLPLSDSNN